MNFLTKQYVFLWCLLELMVFKTLEYAMSYIMSQMNLSCFSSYYIIAPFVFAELEHTNELINIFIGAD